jgi:DNA-binding NarL/FixJ family response regulator
MTAAELRKTEAAYRAASRRSEALRTERNRLIAQALAEGWTHQQIADATGLSRGRVSQIPRP